MHRESLMTDNLDQVGQAAIEHLTLKHAARERALPRSRAAIRCCANSIPATHRQEFHTAGDLMSQPAALLPHRRPPLLDPQTTFITPSLHTPQNAYPETLHS